jgi:cytochrome c
MYRAIALLLSIGFAFSGKAAHADNEELKTLLQRNNCTACHQIDKRKYGPILQEVAAKYAGEAGAVDKIAAKIKAGGTGVWGEDIMPPQPSVSDADAKQLAKLILSLEPKK